MSVASPPVRLVVTRRLPTVWKYNKGVVLQANVGIGFGKLRAKLFVFDTPASLQRFWKDFVGQSVGRKCFAAVNGLVESVEKTDKHGRVTRRTRRVDERYFCVVGLVVGYLTMRVISHESVHVGYAYEKRRARSWWDALARDFDEEAIAYPVGEFANEIVKLLYRKKFLRDVNSEVKKR